MRNRILSLCLSAVILMGAGAVWGTAAQATETAGEDAGDSEGDRQCGSGRDDDNG